MLYALILLAQAGAEPAKDGGGGFLGGSGMLLPMLVVMALFFFLIILPAQRREKKQREEIMSKLKKNDEVVTSSGIIGIVTNIKEGADEVTLKSDDAKIRVLRSSIVRILTKDTKDTGVKEGPPPA